jgi:hypothetical protein
MAYTIVEIYQGTTNTITVGTTTVATTSTTVYVYLIPVDTSDDETTKVAVGNASGAAVGTDIEILCDWSLVSRGRHYMEVVADPGGTPIVLFPVPGEIQFVDIIDSYVVSD